MLFRWLLNGWPACSPLRQSWQMAMERERISTFRGRVPVSVAMLDGRRMSFLDVIPIGSMYGIYANIYHEYTPSVSIYIPAPWILWEMSLFCWGSDHSNALFRWRGCAPQWRKNSALTWHCQTLPGLTGLTPQMIEIDVSERSNM